MSRVCVLVRNSAITTVLKPSQMQFGLTASVPTSSDCSAADGAECSRVAADAVVSGCDSLVAAAVLASDAAPRPAVPTALANFNMSRREWMLGVVEEAVSVC